MCGILLATCQCDLNMTEIVNRGPDSFNRCVIKSNISLIGCVLHQQGSRITHQPIQNDDSLLLWNGENYQNSNGNDGAGLLNRITNVSEMEFLNEISHIDGPYAIIFVKKNDLYFGRDVLGRRSLLLGIDNERKISIMSSTIVDGCDHVVQWIELPALGIFKISTMDDFRLENIRLFPYDFHWPMLKNGLSKHGLCDVIISDEILATNYTGNRFDHSEFPNDVSIADIDCGELLSQLLEKLSNSVKKRVMHSHDRCANCVSQWGLSGPMEEACRHSRISILFSGGVDSAVIAALADKLIPIDQSIDLLNVSFSTNNKTHSESPDRVTGLKCLEELRSINPDRLWNFVEIDIDPPELKQERQSRIAKLIQPCDSVLDDSIGCALWFAARGKGVISGSTTAYNSPTRVVLSGLGADELMAGYSRHRCVFDRQGYDSLQNELDNELHQISSRNMGRDDRVISSHGKEGRFPFLDQEVVSFLMSLPIKLKCDLSKARGLGEKMILRLLARDLLRLNFSWANHKRAIQFGSHIAKVDRLDKGEKASTKCSRLLVD